MKTTGLFAPLLFFFVHNQALAITNVNCDSAKLRVSYDRGEELNVSVYWIEKANFPNPEQHLTAGDLSNTGLTTFNIKCPDFSASYDGNTLSVKSESFDKSLSLIKNPVSSSLNLFYRGWYKYPAIKQDYQSTSYSFDVKSYNLYSGMYKVKEGAAVSGLYSIDIPSTAVIGYRVDGGALKPLLYNRTVSAFKKDMKSADLIDIYHKYRDTSYGVNAKIQYIHIDKSNGILSLSKVNPFPDK